MSADVALPGAAYVRQYLRANLLDGDEGGVLTMKSASLLDVLVELFLDIHSALVDDPHLFDGTSDE